MEAHMETESHNSRWDTQVIPNQSKVFIFNFFGLPNYINSSCWISVGLPHRTHYCIVSLTVLWNWVKLYILSHRLQIKCLIDKEKSKFLVRDVLVPYRVNLILLALNSNVLSIYSITMSALNNNHALYSISSDVPNHSSKNHSLYLLGTLIWKMGL